MPVARLTLPVFRCCVASLLLESLAALPFAAPETEAAQAGSPAANTVRTEQLIIDYTNRYRVQQGRTSLAPGTTLSRTARYFADYMATAYKYGHRADGRQPWERAKMHGYDFCLVSENIAYRYNSAGFTAEELASAFFDGWKTSTDHRKNMLDADVTETAVAISQNKQTGYYFAVQLFGRPKSQMLTFSMANQTGSTFKYKVDGSEFPLPPLYTRSHSRCRQPVVEVELQESQRKGKRRFYPRHGDALAIVFNQRGEPGLEVKNPALNPSPPTRAR